MEPSAIDQIVRQATAPDPRLAEVFGVKVAGRPGQGRQGKVLFSLGKPPAPPREEGPAAPVKGTVKQAPTPVSDLEKSITDTLDQDGYARLAFDRNPAMVAYEVVYQPKPRGIPETILKRISHQDDLIAAIVNTRANQLRAFGIPRPSRHETGFLIEPKEGIVDDLSDEDKAKLDKRIERARDLLVTCGSNEGVPKTKQLSFADFLYVLTQNAIVVGKVAIEKVRTGGRVHSFRPVDAGTILPATTQQTAGPTLRRQALRKLSRLQRQTESELAQKLDLKRWEKDEYSWVQVMDATPSMVFTDDQLIVRNFYPVPDVEMMGHPLPPLDTCVSAVMTHINITTHSKVYFQSGRAAKGMLVIKSDDTDNDLLQYMQEHFQANINNANNSWRLPVFAVGPKDEIAWTPIDQAGSRDSEFQYLGDAVARIIMSSFQISPDELPGWSYLSKGTSAQTLSEGSNEYKLEAHRDLGIRPLIRHFEELINTEILPIIDGDLAKICRVKLTGLDSDSAEKEATRIAEDAPLHMTQNQIHEKVEKEPLPAHLGGDVPLSPQFHALVLDKYVTVGWIRENLLGIPGASKDPRFDYVNNPMFFQQQQLIAAAQQAKQQMDMQQQQLAAQQQAQQQATGPGQAPGAERDAGPGVGDEAPRAQPEHKAEDLHADVRAAYADLNKTEEELDALDKAEHQLSPAQRRALRVQHRIVAEVRRNFATDADKALREVLYSVEDLLGKA